MISICRIDTRVPHQRHIFNMPNLTPNPNCHPNNLSLRLESVRESAQVVGKLAVVRQELNVGTIDQDAAGSLLLEVLVAAKRGETPVLGDDNLLSTGELVLRSSESLKSESSV